MNGCAKKGDLTTLDGSVWSDADSQWCLRAKTPSGSNRQLIFRDESFTYSDQSWNPLWEQQFAGIKKFIISRWGSYPNIGIDLGFILENGDQFYLSPSMKTNSIYVIYKDSSGNTLYYKGIGIS